MTIFVDIDNTICKTEGNNYEHSRPIYNKIKRINKLYNAGNTIIYWTSRGNTSGRDWYIFTVKQLNCWGAVYNELRMGKPSYDIFYCDKSARL